MIDNCKTIAINMRHCARNRQSAKIGGGLFGPAELGAAADKIDAACDLLAALEAIIKMIGPYAGQGRMDAEIAAARAAIARARGE